MSKHLQPWPRKREILENLVHEEQTIEICPKSNALDANNMDTTKGIIQNVRRKTKENKREEIHMTQEVKGEDKK